MLSSQLVSIFSVEVITFNGEAPEPTLTTRVVRSTDLLRYYVKSAARLSESTRTDTPILCLGLHVPYTFRPVGQEFLEKLDGARPFIAPTSRGVSSEQVLCLQVAQPSSSGLRNEAEHLATPRHRQHPAILWA
jgi:hypothetical protein